MTLKSNIPYGGNMQNTYDGHGELNLSADGLPFGLKGGRYGLTVNAGAWNSGAVNLKRLALDGATFVATISDIGSDTVLSVDLPVGTYKITVASATGVYVDVTAEAISN